MVLVGIDKIEFSLLQAEHGDIGSGTGSERSELLSLPDHPGGIGGNAADHVFQAHAQVEELGHGRRQIEDRSLGRAGERQVGRDRVGQKSRVQGLPDKWKREVHAPVRAVKNNPLFLGRPDFFENGFLFRPHDAVCKPVEAVGHHIARLEEF